MEGLQSAQLDRTVGSRTVATPETEITVNKPEIQIFNARLPMKPTDCLAARIIVSYAKNESVPRVISIISVRSRWLLTVRDLGRLYPGTEVRQFPVRLSSFKLVNFSRPLSTSLI